jgi:hypothetical protein
MALPTSCCTISRMTVTTLFRLGMLYLTEPPRIGLCQKVSLPKAPEFPITSRSMYWMNRGAVVRRCCHSAFDDDETKSGFQRGRVK